jgi:hypothetical protein
MKYCLTYVGIIEEERWVSATFTAAYCTIHEGEITDTKFELKISVLIPG